MSKERIRMSANNTNGPSSLEATAKMMERYGELQQQQDSIGGLPADSMTELKTKRSAYDNHLIKISEFQKKLVAPEEGETTKDNDLFYTAAEKALTRYTNDSADLYKEAQDAQSEIIKEIEGRQRKTRTRLGAIGTAVFAAVLGAYLTLTPAKKPTDEKPKTTYSTPAGEDKKPYQESIDEADAGTQYGITKTVADKKEEDTKSELEDKLTKEDALREKTIDKLVGQDKPGKKEEDKKYQGGTGTAKQTYKAKTKPAIKKKLKKQYQKPKKVTIRKPKPKPKIVPPPAPVVVTPKEPIKKQEEEFKLYQKSK